MRRLFPLKANSNSINNNNSNNLSASKVDKDGRHFWEKGGDDLKENSLEEQLIRDYSCPPRKNFRTGGNSNRSSPRSTTNLGPRFESSIHRRSQSSCSSIFSEKNESSLSDASKSSASSVDVFVPRNKYTPAAAMANGHGESRGAKVVWTNRSTSAPKGRPEGDISTPPNPPQPLLRSNSARFLEFKFVGRDEDEEDAQSMASGKAQAEIVADNETLLGSNGRPPRSRLSGQENIGSIRGLIRSQSSKGSFGNIGEKPSSKVACDLLSSAKSSTSSNSVADRLSSRYQSARNVAERLVRSLPGKSKPKSASFDAKNTFDQEAVLLHCDGRLRREFLGSMQAQGSEFGSYHSSGTEEEAYSSRSLRLSPQEQGISNEERQYATCQVQGVEGLREVERSRFQMWLDGFEKIDDTDEELERRAKEAEDQAELLSKELESVNWCYRGKTEGLSAKKSDLNSGLLRQKLREVCEGKRELALVLSSEVRSRMRERSAATESLKLIKGEMESRTKLLENEKNNLQFSLEKELDRRSSEWAAMLEKIKSEERRLRDRVRDLAEQNVALQREVSSLNNRDMNTKTQARESQLYMNDLQTKLADAANEIIRIRESLTESLKRTKQVEDDRDSIKRSYKEKERENYDLQKSVVRLQRLCKDQEKTIGGLLQGLDKDASDCLQDSDDRITKLQREQLRLAAVEQGLRKDLENCRWETDALRHENTSLLERVRSREKGTGFGLIKLDQELWDRLDGLQDQAIPLLEENAQLSGKLLDFIQKNLAAFDACETNGREISYCGITNGPELDYALEMEMVFQSLRRKVDSFKKSVWMQKEVLKEKSHLSCNESLKQDAESTETRQPELEHSESGDGLSELQQELKAETLLVKILREKLCSKEADLEQLQEEVATLVRSQEVLRSNNESLQGRLSISNQKEKELELLLGGKDNTIHRLQTDLQECLKELTLLRGEIPKVSDERDAFQQEVEQLSWQNMRLNAEVEGLKRRVEKLDEDVLVKEGQLSILQESLIT